MLIGVLLIHKYYRALSMPDIWHTFEREKRSCAGKNGAADAPVQRSRVAMGRDSRCYPPNSSCRARVTCHSATASHLGHVATPSQASNRLWKLCTVAAPRCPSRPSSSASTASDCACPASPSINYAANADRCAPGTRASHAAASATATIATVRSSGGG